MPHETQQARKERLGRAGLRILNGLLTPDDQREQIDTKITLAIETAQHFLSQVDEQFAHEDL